ncbi:SusC/RagA family TonB-linked outer membrane protein [Joostella sp.]|uniref:SusC/RagA family TonB-linked outer membrane protein n=1 Tax=Joostella sp. TaxID=2231138 RepID=UPI003A9349A2
MINSPKLKLLFFKKRILLIFFFLCGFIPIYGQSVNITGIVKDAVGTPLPGVNVIEKGTSNGVATDFDGNFSISSNNNEPILVFTYLGFTKKEIAINGQTSFNVVLEEDLNQLDEVVVVGYGTQKKGDLTGAIATVKEEDFSPGVNSNASDLLKGTASGVSVTSASSAPGDAPVVRIRGAGSINSSNGVLYVVDGLPGISPNDLSPGDIESIEVLKDASAAAIYGTRAANGVILITTKKGKEGKAIFSYSTYTGIQDVPKTIDVLDATDYKKMVNQRLEFRGDELAYSEEDILGTDVSTNWQDEIFRTAFVNNHQLSASGGTKTGSYYVGLNYFDQDGVIDNTGTQKYNIRTNIESEPLEDLKMSFGINYTEETINSAYSQGADGGLITSAIRATPIVPTGIDAETGRFYDVIPTAQDNPLAFIYGRDDENVRRRFYATFNTDYEIVDNLTATLRLGAESNNSRRDVYSNRLSNGGLANGGIASISTGESRHWLVETLLKYENTFSEKHDFSVLGGATWEKFDNKGFGGNVRGFISDVLGSNSLQSGDGDEGDNLSSSRTVNQLNGFLGRMTYSFDNRYLLTASFRVDGSSRFAEDNKYAFFPSASVGWRIDQEKFMENTDWINQLKIRVGYGELGNQGINNFETRQTLVPGGNSVFGGSVVQGVVPARLPNPDLTWETTSETNIGFDYGFLNNRISGSIDYFYRVTADQLFNKPLPSTVGFGSVRTNIGEVLNTGIDFSLSTKNFVKENFNWNTTLNLSYLKNETLELPDFTEQIIGGNAGNFITGYYIIEEGSPMFSYYGYTIEGLFQEGDDIANTPTPTEGYKPGMPKFKDVNGDGTINADDRAIIGNPFPKFSYGVRNTFGFHNFTLDVFIYGVEDVDTFSNDIAESIYPVNTTTNTISKYYDDRWTPDNTTTLIPSGEDYSLYAGGYAVNNLTVVDASYVRLKNVTLAYQVLLNNSFISSLKLFIAGDNLVTWTDFEGYDPEASVSGGSVSARSYNSYPSSRVFRLGLDIKF